MLKEKRQIIEVFFIVADLVVVSLAWIGAYVFRFQTSLVEVDKGIPAFSTYLGMMIVIWIIWASVFRKMGLYRPMRGVRRMREVLMLMNANLFALVILVATIFLFREKSAPFSRLVLIYFAFFSLFATIITRTILRSILREFRRRGYNLRYMLIVGAGKVAGDIASRVRLHNELGVQLVGCLSLDGQEEKGPWGLPVVGSYGDITNILSRSEIDQVVVALPLEDHTYLPQVMEALKDSTVDVKIIPDIYQFVSIGGSIEEFEGLPVIGVQESPLDGTNLLIKRVTDLLCSFLMLLILSPFLLIIALIVRLTSRGPAMYKQERMSVDGTKFSIYKFRTMRLDAENSGPGWTTVNDQRVTFFGNILRKTSIDELPQLFNVLKGDMSLVGPRPERPIFINEFRKKIPSYMLRHKVPAGITGWAQINGWRGDTSIDKRIEYDLYYIKNWSLWLDIKILFFTLFRGFLNKNAY